MGNSTQVRHAVGHAFDTFTTRMDRLVLEEYLTKEDVTLELHQQGFIDFADMWENYIEQDCE